MLARRHDGWPRARVFLCAGLLAAAGWLPPAAAQTMSGPPNPVYHVHPTLGTPAFTVTSPEKAVPRIREDYSQLPHYVWVEPPPPVTVYCEARPPLFTPSDFLTRPSAPNLSFWTASKSIPRTAGACIAYAGSPGWEYCVAGGCAPTTEASYAMVAECPIGWQFRSAGNRNWCDCPAGQELARGADGAWRCSTVCKPWQDTSACWQHDGSCSVGNPALPGVAAKVQEEVDYEGAGGDALSFRRVFRSDGARPYVEPGGWSHWVHNWGRRVETYPVAGWASSRAYLIRPDASQLVYTTTGNGSWVAWQLGDRNRLTETRDASGARTGFRYQLWADDSVEHYDAQGRLLKVVQRNGWTTTLSYSTATTPAAVAPWPGLLVAVRNHFGRELRFSYDAAGRLRELLPPGAVPGAAPGSSASPVRYGHEEPASLGAGVPAAGQLSSVTWADGRTRRYHYEHAAQPGLLTGISDETGTRIGSYRYTATGRLQRTEGPGGANAVELSANGATSYVIDRSGPTPQTTTYRWEQVQGLIRPTSVSAPCPLCGSSSASTAYTATGEVARSTAHDGRITFFRYDAKGREIERAIYPASHNTATSRPALSEAESVTTTRWHASWNLPLERAQPGWIEVYTYGSASMLTSTTRQATTDATGALGLAAARTGSVLRTETVYDTSRLPTRVTEVVDGVQTAAYAYQYIGGNASRVTATDAAGTSVGDLLRDAHGRITQLSTSAGGISRFGYDLRGRLASATLPDWSAAFDRDARGLIQLMRFGDGAWIRIVYDAAGMPLRVEDSSGLSQPLAQADLERQPDATDPGLPQRLRQWLDRLRMRTAAVGARVVRQLPPLPPAHAQVPPPPTQVMVAQGQMAGGLARLPAGQAGAMSRNPLDSAPVRCCDGDSERIAIVLQRQLDEALLPARVLGYVAESVVNEVVDTILILKSARRLKRNMCAAGVRTPPYCYETHHIVHRGGYDPVAAARSREILAMAGIDIDDALNGIFLDCVRHRATKNPAYDVAVRDQLESVRTKNYVNVAARLRQIALWISQGTPF